MPDAAAPNPTPPASGFPVVTAGATLVTLFLFFGLVVVAYRSPSYLGGGRLEPKADPAAKLKEVQARSQAVLDGADNSTKMSTLKAAGELEAHAGRTKDAKEPHGRLPYPVEPAAPAGEKK